MMLGGERNSSIEALINWLLENPDAAHAASDGSVQSLEPTTSAPRGIFLLYT